MYCNKCGKEVTEDSVFCKFCGAKLTNEEVDDTEKQSSNENITANQNSTTAKNTIKSIGGALTLIGLICGFLIFIFRISNGESVGYDSWNYFYGGGRETSMGIAVFSGAAFLIGIFMLMVNKDSDDKQ